MKWYVGVVVIVRCLVFVVNMVQKWDLPFFVNGRMGAYIPAPVLVKKYFLLCMFKKNTY